MNEPSWVTEKIAIAIHSDQIAQHGGSLGIRDRDLLSASLARPRHLFTYSNPNIFDLAAALGYAVTKNHPFVDGNKRTAFMLMYVFLRLNGYMLNADEKESVLVMEELANSEVTQDTLATWLIKNCLNN